MNNIRAIGLTVALLMSAGSVAAAPNYSHSGGAYVAAPNYGHSGGTYVAAPNYEHSGGTYVAQPNHGRSSGSYVGADYGKYKMSVDDSSDRYEDANFRAFLGYQLNRYFAIEGGLSSMTLENQLGNVADLTGMDISLLTMLPITSKFSAYAKLGYWDWTVDQPLIVDGVYYDGFGDTDMLYGIGLEYKVSTRFKFRLDATRYDAGDAEIDTLSGSIAYSF